LQAPPVYPTPCLFVFVPLLLPSLSKLHAFCFLSVFLLLSLPPTPFLTFFLHPLFCSPVYPSSLSLSLSLCVSYFRVSLASSSSSSL
jgi:hypothetical protein